MKGLSSLEIEVTFKNAILILGRRPYFSARVVL
jgi:hypothetical protein